MSNPDPNQQPQQPQYAQPNYPYQMPGQFQPMPAAPPGPLPAATGHGNAVQGAPTGASELQQSQINPQFNTMQQPQQIYYQQYGYSNPGYMAPGFAYPPQYPTQGYMPGYPSPGFQQPGFPLAYNPPMMATQFQPPTQFPTIQPNNTQVPQLQTKITTLTAEVEEKETKIRELNEKIEDLERQIKKLKGENTDKNEEITNYQKRIAEIESQITQLEAANKLQNTRIKQMTLDIENKNQAFQNLTIELENQELEKQSQINQLRQEYKKQQALPIQQQVDPQVALLQSEIKKLKSENQILLKKNTEYETQMKGMSTQDQIDELQAKIDYEHKNFMDAKDEIMRIKQQSNTKINQQESELSSLREHIFKLNSDVRVIKQKLKDADTFIENLKQQLETEQNANKALEAELNKPQIDRSHITKIQEAQEKLRNQMREQQRLQDESNAQKIEELRKESEKRLQKLQEQKRQDQIGRNKRNQEQLANQMGKAAQNLGTLDVCYIIDSTLSMEPYIKQTRNCIKQSSQLIKKLTNRDTNWSAICYYDIEQKPANGLYLQHDFTKNMDDIEKFLDGIKTKGGSDPPEDVKGAVQQMLVNLKWSARFKIALLITDSPCHGLKYHNQRDNHPNDDMDETIIQLIDQNIILIGLNFTKHSTQMYQVIGKLFEAKQKKDNFSFVEMNGAAMETIGAKMAKCIGDASQNATGTNNNSTKSKRLQQARSEAKDGAMEALCKQGNFYDFEKQPNVQCVQTKLKVLKVEITQEAFDKNLLDINNIGTLNSDYRVTEEGQWDCIRTDKPFAFGMMKDVFLMKKNGAPDELYVIKTPIGSEPYKTQAEAIAECRSHLLCQQLMNKFQKDIEEAVQAKKVFKQYPKVVYSSFLILKETETKYWIAERFFKGEFVKYNNNFGFMNDSEDELNKFAQAFSLYTLYISGSNYIINDVQGVGIYFTDPAINTLTGNFDDTDMGEDGMGMFLVNYQSKRHLTKEIEDLLDIKF